MYSVTGRLSVNQISCFIDFCVFIINLSTQYRAEVIEKNRRLSPGGYKGSDRGVNFLRITLSLNVKYFAANFRGLETRSNKTSEHFKNRAQS